MWRASWSRLARDVRGLSTVEYTVLLVLVVTGAIGAWSKLGGNLITKVQAGADSIGSLAPDTSGTPQGN
jgi:Flp pilus assembly pilin Flp